MFVVCICLGCLDISSCLFVLFARSVVCIAEPNYNMLGCCLFGVWFVLCLLLCLLFVALIVCLVCFCFPLSDIMWFVCLLFGPFFPVLCARLKRL